MFVEYATFKFLFLLTIAIVFLWFVVDYLWYRHKQATRIANKEIDQIRNQRGW